MSQIFEEVADVVTDKPVLLTISVRPKNRMHAFLQRIKLLPGERSFQLTQCSLGSLIRITKLLSSINMDFETAFTDFYKTAEQFGPTIVRVVAAAIHNRRSEPPGWLLHFVEENVSPSELADIFGVVLKQLRVEDFIKSIILVKGLTLREMSRLTEGS